MTKKKSKRKKMKKNRLIRYETYKARGNAEAMKRMEDKYPEEFKVEEVVEEKAKSKKGK